jgi:transposase
MIQLEFTPEAITALHHERFHHPHPRVQRKMEVLLLKSNGLSHQQIARITRVSVNTVTSYVRAYKQGGIDRLKQVNFYKPRSPLHDHSGTIEAYFREKPPASIKEAMDIIEKLTGIHRSATQVRVFLRSLGIRRRKVGMIPAKADIQQQNTFKKDQLAPRLAEAKSGNRAVFFVDAVHVVFAPFLGYLWCFSRLFVKAPAGRSRFNVLGAINAISHELITVTNESYINAQVVCELLWKIYHLQLGIPITLVLDNARYQKCALVIDLAKSLNIELLHLPPYSPNLNIIERLWKFMKKKCLYSKYYKDFSSFKSAITTFLDETQTIYKDELNSLLTLRFQTFKESQIIAA